MALAPGSLDAEEVRRLLEGDREVFEALFRRVNPKVLAMARRLVGDAHGAEDVAQDTWQAVVRGLPRFEGVARLETWILQIAVHRARSSFVRSRRASPLGEAGGGDVAFTTLGAWRGAPAAWPASEGSPEDVHLKNELVTIASRALEALPELQRAVVMMRDVEGLDAVTACTLLGLSDATHRSLLHRGRLRIRGAIVAAGAR